MIFKQRQDMGSFSEADFEQKLLYLKDTHDSISTLSSWCLSKHEHHAKIVSIWLNVLKGVKIEHRLILFYLANDVIQYSKRKSLPFVDAFAPALQKATTLVREDSVRNKILRLFKIWDERGIYDEGFLVDLSSLLSHGNKNTNGIDLQDFQPSLLYTKIRTCKELEDETDLRLKLLNENHISFTDVDKLRNVLKDRAHGDDLISDFDEGVKHVNSYVEALDAEIKERNSLIDLLEIGEQHYAKEFKEAKVVVNAYKCFATRVRGVKRKLEEKIETMPSPIPSPDINAPSPSPEPKDSDVADESDLDKSYLSQDEIKVEKPADSPYSPDLPKSQFSSLYNPAQTFQKNPISTDSNPQVYIPPKVNKPKEYKKEEYGVQPEFFAGYEKKDFSVKGTSLYSDSSRESMIDSNRDSYYSNPPNPAFYSKPEIKEEKLYKQNEDEDVYSGRAKSPLKIKQEYYSDSVNAYPPVDNSVPLLTSDMQYFPKPATTSSFPTAVEPPSKPPITSHPNSKYLNDSDSCKTQNYTFDFNRDDYSKSSNEDNTYSSSDKILSDDFVRGATFSKTSFADSLKDFYLPKSLSENSNLFSRNDRINGMEGGMEKEPKEKIALSALLQTLIPPDLSTLHTIVPKSPSALTPPTNDTESWQTPESPPSYEKTPTASAYEDPSSGHDVDMRTIDVDHRNLISLTTNDSSDWGNDDADYRPFINPSSALSPKNEPVDDVENVDMEMSDEEDKAFEVTKNNLTTVLPVPPPTPTQLIKVGLEKQLVQERRYDNNLVTLVPPPPPPPPPPQATWHPIAPPPSQPPSFPNQATFNPLYFNRPPPPPHSPQFRPTFRPFHRPPPRFQRW